jgi:stage II sporulation protein D
MRIRSTHFRVRIEGQEMIFEDGRGFGHGLGLCQWGMEGQAREGRTAGQILRYYYPGAQLTRAY